MAADTVLTPELVRVIAQAPGTYRFTVPEARRPNAYEWLSRQRRHAGARLQCETAGDTMWVTVE